VPVTPNLTFADLASPSRWIEACINEEIDAITTMEESLRNGVVLAKLARYFDPTSVRKIFEVCR